MDVIRSRIGHIALVLAAILLINPTPLQGGVISSITKARIAGASGRPDAALRHLQQAMDRGGELPSLYPPLAEAALAAGEYELASEYITKIRANSTDDTQIKCLQFDLQARLGHLEEALETWQQVDFDCPVDLDFIKRSALEMLSENHLDQVREVITRLADERPDDAQLRFVHGLYLATSAPDASLPFLRRSSQLEAAGNAIALDLVRTIEDARIEDDQAYVLAQVGQTLAKHGQWNFAVKAFQAAIELEPTYADAYAFLGLSLDEIGESGFEAYKRAIQLSPDQALAYIYLGMHWLRNGFPEIALRKFETAAEIEPQNPVIVVQIGHAHELLGNIEIAMDAYRTATDLAPQNPTFWIVLAQTSLKHEFNVPTLGQPAARNAVALDPDNPLAVDALGYSYYLLGDFEYADRMITRAIELDPMNPQIQYHLGLLRASQNKYQESKSAFEMASMLDPDGVVGKLAARALETISR